MHQHSDKMALINEKTQFDADKISNCVVGIAADIGKHDSGMHQHKKGQLLYAPQGCMSFALEDSICQGRLPSMMPRYTARQNSAYVRKKGA